MKRPGNCKEGIEEAWASWCSPGKDTPSFPQTTTTPPTVVRGAVVDWSETLNFGTSGKSDRVPVVKCLGNISQKQIGVHTRQGRGRTVKVHLARTRLL